jgi:hypothetical protein
VRDNAVLKSVAVNWRRNLRARCERKNHMRFMEVGVLLEKEVPLPTGLLSLPYFAGIKLPASMEPVAILITALDLRAPYRIAIHHIIILNCN